MAVIDVNTTTNKYQVIYADPPWKYGRTGKKKWKPAKHYYPTLKPAEVGNLLKPILSKIADDNCLLFMWVVSPEIDKIIEVVKGLGFDYITVAFVWHKMRANVGNYTMSGCELCLLFKKGKIPSDRVRNPGTKQFLEERSTTHSTKPKEIANRIAKMFPISRKIELFARDQKPGWDCWGNEV